MTEPERTITDANDFASSRPRAARSLARRPPFRWSDIWRSPLHDLPIRDEILYQYLPLAPDEDVLEIGPGSGFTAFRLSRLVRQLTLLDVAAGTVDRLKKSLEGIPNLGFVCADVCAPDLCEKIAPRFDAIYALEVFEYVTDAATCLRNLAGLLKPRGRLLLNWPNYSTDRTRGVNYVRAAKELEALMRQAGFLSWEVYALRLRPHARLIFRELHERPLNVYRRLRGQDAHSAQTFDKTWTYQQGWRMARYRGVTHAAWTLIFAGLRLGGDCFERVPIKEDRIDGNLLLIGRR